MNTNRKNFLLGTFAVLTVVFASLTVLEYTRINSPGAQTLSLRSSNSSSSSTCTVPACPGLLNYSWTISVIYTGPWGASYQGYVYGSPGSGPLVKTGSFYGHGAANESITVSGWSQSGGEVKLCVEAQKLDSSNSTLTLRMFPPNAVSNETSLAYGTTNVCESNFQG